MASSSDSSANRSRRQVQIMIWGTVQGFLDERILSQDKGKILIALQGVVQRPFVKQKPRFSCLPVKGFEIGKRNGKQQPNCQCRHRNENDRHAAAGRSHDRIDCPDSAVLCISPCSIAAEPICLVRRAIRQLAASGFSVCRMPLSRRNAFAHGKPAIATQPARGSAISARLAPIHHSCGVLLISGR
jgi:hypothetical protein